jgi:hypothetical protein
VYDRTLINLGYLMDRQGDPAAAEAHFRAALARRLARDGPVAAGTLNAMTSLARVLLARGAVDEAAVLADTVVAVRLRYHPSRHWTIGDAYLLRASVLIARGQPAEAESLSRSAAAMFREIYGDHHIQVAFAENRVAEAVGRQGRTQEAVSLQRDVVGLYRRVAGPRHPNTLAAVVRLAELEWEAGNDAMAATLYREALSELETITPAPTALASPRIGLGSLLAEAGRCEEAGPLLRIGLLYGAPRTADETARVERARSLLARCDAGVGERAAPARSGDVAT